MSANMTGFGSRDTRAPGAWERSAHWVAPLVTAALVGLATFVMFASCGASLI